MASSRCVHGIGEPMEQAGEHGMSGPLSDEDPAVVNEKRHKRMLSNRESARRSRLRKQHHLEDMKKQLSQLHAENMEMASRYSIASRHYSQITEENRLLRTHAMELSRRLQRLHHLAASHGAAHANPHTHAATPSASLPPEMPLGFAPLDSSLPLSLPPVGPLGSVAAYAGLPGASSIPGSHALSLPGAGGMPAKGCADGNSINLFMQPRALPRAPPPLKSAPVSSNVETQMQ